MALTDRRDQADVPGSLPESLATEHECGSAASHRGLGTVPVQQPQRMQEEKV